MSTMVPSKIARKLILLSAMLVFLGGLVFTGGTQSAAANNRALICCSACDVENPPLPCLHGCSPSCRN